MELVVDKTDYELIIGRKPRGYGFWRFMIGAAVYHYTGTFACAAKSAMAVALSSDERSIKVLPPTAAELQ